MAIDDKTLLLIRKTFGRKIETDNDVYELIAKIRDSSGEELGINTVKRLLGLLPGTDNPRTSTRNIIARYLGFANWDSYSRSLKMNDPLSCFGYEEGTLLSDRIRKGSIVSFRFGYDKNIALEYLGERHYKVLTITNSKLRQNDILVVSRFIESGYFLADEVIRGNRELGPYNSVHKIAGLSVSEPDSSPCPGLGIVDRF